MQEGTFKTELPLNFCRILIKLIASSFTLIRQRTTEPLDTMPETYDHAGGPVTHGRARVNGIRVHYITAGSGPPLLLLHGTPKSHYYWYRLIPFLTPHFTVVAPDLRGFGATDKPPASEGYDCLTQANDVAELMRQLGHEKYHVHGEVRCSRYRLSTLQFTTLVPLLRRIQTDREAHLRRIQMVLR